MSKWSRRRFCALVPASGLALRLLGEESNQVVTSSLHSSHERTLAQQIARDPRFPVIRDLGRQLLASGLRAGTTYPEVWIRDTNTFIEASLDVTDPAAMRDAFRSFLLLQSKEGDIVDGYLPSRANRTAAHRSSPLLPGVSGFKNTVESDQESSLISAVRKYVDKTHDRAFLDEVVEGTTMRLRLRSALAYVMQGRWDSERGLVWAGATIDWGDIEPEDKLGDQIDERSHPAVSIYPNAMFAVAVRDYLTLLPVDDPDRSYWAGVLHRLHNNVRRYLWSARAGKYRTHLYLKGSPFPADFNEDEIYYFGGTAIAVEAGFLTLDEVRVSLAGMRQRVKAAQASSIGLTVYPTYPKDYFLNPSVAEPYRYQNGGDWCWFGARMVQQLVAYGLVADAYQEFGPMLDRVIKHGDFYEWWSRDNQPRGSAHFRGSAGVMLKAIDMLSIWAAQHA